jgi:hypothetical protein
MNYKRIYDEIINNRIINKLDKKLVSVEQHHIIPRCVGGTDEESNIVSLTPREHFLCHLLLTKIYTDEATPFYYKIVKAFFMMFSYSKNNSTRHVRINGRVYENLKKDWIKSLRLSQSGENNSQFGCRWINNGIVDKMLRKEEKIPEGFVFGRIKKVKQPKTKKIDNRNNNIRKYSEWYILYKEHGFKKFSEMVGYTASQQNLVMQFSKYVEDFIPNPGGRRYGFNKG